MKKVIKITVLHVLKLAGFFRLARWITRRKLRILCYHGIALRDEWQFRPTLFMRAATFQQRLQIMKRRGCHIIPLATALGGLQSGDLPDLPTVLTIDDGWYSTYRAALPILARFRMPATIYVTSYYVERNMPVFNVLTAYALWASPARSLELANWPERIRGPWTLADDRDRSLVLRELIGFADDQCGAADRLSLARDIVQALGLDWAQIDASRSFYLMNEEEIAQMAAAGMDVQLHTHRHRFPRDAAAVEREIKDNRFVLERLTHRKLNHFCYPSGIYDPCQWPWLERLGIESATTCRGGLNGPDTPRLELRRFLDGEDVALIEFEAEIDGALELLRRIFRRPERNAYEGALTDAARL
ncbi:MAG TPA: polysaccharide deacetylase family protein [Stellaceae bacterium]|nr:polysaccharide deacetylase family protein [Stellaceae bacterium]